MRRHRLEIATGPRPPARILVTEDEPAVADLIAYNLELDGHLVDCATDGEAALRAIREQPPDLIVLDLLLPLRSGWQVLRDIRSDPEPRIARLPVLVVSALACDRLARQLADGYQAEVIGKPFSVDELRSTVRRALIGAGDPRCGEG
jgi:DNA-binding response OmpR family regulator